MRLIDADAFKACMKGALEQTRNAYTDGGEWAQTITEQFCEAIDEQPTVEPDTDTISRQAVLDAILQKPAWHNSDGSFYHSDDIKDAVNAVPPSAQPQRMGHWIDRNDNVATCSVCGKRWGLYRLLNYCPNCGAEMTEGEG